MALKHEYHGGGDSIVPSGAVLCNNSGSLRDQAMIPDPDMEVTVDFGSETAQAETYQDTYVYREATDERSRKELSEALMMWLGNLIEQGHRMVDSPSNQ